MLHALIYVIAMQKLDHHQLHVRHEQHLALLHAEHLAHERDETRAVTASDVRTDVSGNLGCSGLESLWLSAGGAHSAAFVAAEIAMAESGGNQYATGPYGERGYWQINPDHGALSTYNPQGNAKAAIIISDDGGNWSPWTTYTSGAYIGRC